ncbi:MAG TPA: polyprenyl synthetase family protein [bacterium]|nr:polyprenyl synthetase family protein [bacterium]HQG44555.1 polyprenyl synthetase family protein [bacterium]HQI48191.1 polyprenyl synthetase family protein [bacterium]HQJ64548.1 polyprenyl synthetase family protein [bacterium]
MKIESIFAPIDGPLHDFEDAFQEILQSDIPLANQVVHYIAGLKGKRLRPALVFLASRLHGEVTPWSMAAAVVVELLHTATLVHDDVVDTSELRRGKPTVNSIWDNRISVLVGDLLFSRTLNVLVDLQSPPALGIVSEMANRITEGELLQVEHEHDYQISEPVYFDLVAKKTAALFAASCELGALAVADDPGARQRMKEFGENLGIAFQIKDDLLDYAGNVAVLGKPVANDIRENKVTLPLIYAFAHAPEEATGRIIALLEKQQLAEEDIRTIIDFVRERGGLAYAEEMAHHYCSKAAAILEGYAPSQVRDALMTLVQFAISREK